MQRRGGWEGGAERGSVILNEVKDQPPHERVGAPGRYARKLILRFAMLAQNDTPWLGPPPLHFDTAVLVHVPRVD